MKVAVVGSGVSGLAATWALNEFSDHEVHLYEADSRPGGHANTVTYTKPGASKDRESIDVDTGFIVFNPCTYPNFLRFLEMYPKIPIKPTEMTFSISRDHGKFEWAGDNLRTIFCQLGRLLDPNMWRMIYDVLRFNASARRLIAQWNSGDDTWIDMSIGDYLTQNGYSESFSDNYLIPMTAAIWNTPPDKCALDFPARTLIQFMHNHHLLQITGKPSWLTIPGGSRQYVQTILSSLPSSQLHLSTPITSLSTIKTEDDSNPRVTLTTDSGDVQEYDHVILACHSDTALSILKAGSGLSSEEQAILGMFQWNKNHAVLHNDEKLMPRSRLAWSCWNYLTYSELDPATAKRKANCDRVALTYGMNDLQHIPESKYGPVLVTLNPPFEPDPDRIVGRYAYDHPVLDSQAVKAQTLMPTIQGTRGISYAGAYLKYGFHEDGFTSGLLAATRYVGGVKLPWSIMLPEGDETTPARVGELAYRPVKSGCGTYHGHGSGATSGGAVWLLALCFDVFERMGARALVGCVMGVVLGVVRGALGVVGVKVGLDG
ncbi:amine oxidase [Moniliophthora roreri MCA 2997]|uniref:Amine oxidase n=2 Tax=Moniliophthora roreri TaxID=221103 RepID=V2WZF5_MONRO|nr:amine oxidase [Moniliophthora roreri MCA 2997]